MAKIPQTFEEWEHCITVQCGIPLTPSFIAKRIAELEDESDFRTQQFIKTWDRDYHAKTVEWFRRAASRLSQ